MRYTCQTFARQLVLVGTLVIGIIVGTATQARAQMYVGPLVGYNFGGNVGCPQLDDCRDKRINAAVSFGAMGNLFGVEEEIAYVPDFFGDVPFVDSSVMTLMSNVMFVPNMGPVRPYALAGIGLFKTHIALTIADILSIDNYNLGWNAGGGLIGFVGGHIGVRGDIRYFHSVQDLRVLGFTLKNTKLNFGRVSAGVVLKF